MLVDTCFLYINATSGIRPEDLSLSTNGSVKAVSEVTVGDYFYYFLEMWTTVKGRLDVYQRVSQIEGEKTWNGRATDRPHPLRRDPGRLSVRASVLHWHPRRWRWK